MRRPKGPGVTNYTPEVAADILERLANGEPLEDICDSEDMPAPRTVRHWKSVKPDFAQGYAEARRDGADAIAADCLHIADTCPADRDAVAKAKLKIETRLKLLAKWFPAEYGERMAIDMKSTVADLTEAQIDARIAQLQTAAAGAATVAGGEGEEEGAPEA